MKQQVDYNELDLEILDFVMKKSNETAIVYTPYIFEYLNEKYGEETITEYYTYITKNLNTDIQKGNEQSLLLSINLSSVRDIIAIVSILNGAIQSNHMILNKENLFTKIDYVHKENNDINVFICEEIYDDLEDDNIHKFHNIDYLNFVYCIYNNTLALGAAYEMDDDIRCEVATLGDTITMERIDMVPIVPVISIITHSN